MKRLAREFLFITKVVLTFSSRSSKYFEYPQQCKHFHLILYRLSQPSLLKSSQCLLDKLQEKKIMLLQQIQILRLRFTKFFFGKFYGQPA